MIGIATRRIEKTFRNEVNLAVAANLDFSNRAPMARSKISGTTIQRRSRLNKRKTQ